MKIRKHCEDQSCPCCGVETEDTLHLFQCPNEEIQKTFEDECDNVEDYLSATTSIAIKTMILTTLHHHLRKGTMPTMIEDTDEEKIIYDQLQLGQKVSTECGLKTG
jgi:hypothetical protein